MRTEEEFDRMHDAFNRQYDRAEAAEQRIAELEREQGELDGAIVWLQNAGFNSLVATAMDAARAAAEEGQ